MLLVENVVERVLAGEREAFVQLIEHYRDAVCGVAYHYLGNFDDVQDAAQEAFIQAYIHLDQLQDSEKFGPWLRRVTANVSKDILRRKSRAPLSLEEVPESPSNDDPQKSAMRLIVRDALSRLSDKVRLTVTLCYINGYSHDEVAGFLEVPVNTVRSRLQLAKKQLREEMITMVSDVLHEDKPGDEFFEQLMDTWKRYEAAREAGDMPRALQVNEESMQMLEQVRATSAFDKFKQDILEGLRTAEENEIDKRTKASDLRRIMKTSPEKLLLELEINLIQANAFVYAQMNNSEESIRRYEHALSLAEESGDRRFQAEVLKNIAHEYERTNHADLAMPYFQKAYQASIDAGDKWMAADCLWYMGYHHLNLNQIAESKQCLSEANSLFVQAKAHQQAIQQLYVSKALLDLIAEVGDDRVASLIHRTSACLVLEKKVKRLYMVAHNGAIFNPGEDMPSPLLVTGTIGWMGELDIFNDSSLSVGESWSGELRGMPGLQGIVTVKSISERVETPAGIFEFCLLTELIIQEESIPSHIPDDRKERIRNRLCGKRLAWYAPGAGLVQIKIQTQGGIEALFQLKEFTVQGSTKSYFPLAVGNFWTYTCPDLPEEYGFKETYRVAEKKGSKWYLEHYGYAFKRQ